MSMPCQFAICGAGPVGLACAALLAEYGVAPHAIALIDGKPQDMAARDPRSIALSHASRMLLERLGAWPIEATPIHQIHISRAGRFGRTLIDRGERGLDALGYVTRYGAIVAALTAVCERRGIAMMRPVRVTGSQEHGEHVRLTLEDAASAAAALDAGIVIQAEGGVFGEQAVKTVTRDYGQTALVAQVAAAAPAGFRAYERFTDDGPLALLPQEDGLPADGGSRYALVWCTAPDKAQRLRTLDDRTFLAELQTAFGNRLGAFRAVGPRAAFPLGLNAGTAAQGRTVAIGNAAQTLHPVAGQGLNLGLRDAQELARLLAREATPAALAGFAASRQGDRDFTVRMTDTMARAFVGARPLQPLLGAALGLLDTATPVKQAFADLMIWGRR
jgi:2-octaprenyl-6-methoxyphenol hydroxylase